MAYSKATSVRMSKNNMKMLEEEIKVVGRSPSALSWN